MNESCITSREKARMQHLCIQRQIKLSLYMDPSLTLFARLKFVDSKFESNDLAFAICLHLYIKFIGPYDVIEEAAAFKLLRSSYPYISEAKIKHMEYDICSKLGWKFATLVPYDSENPEHNKI